jgi:phage-related protein
MPVSCVMIKEGVPYDLSQYGLALLKHDIPPNPEKEDYTFQIPGRAGKVRMGTLYKERTFSLEFLLMADDPTVDYQSKVADISELLDASGGPQYWIFGDMSGKRFLGEYNGSESIEKMIFDGRLTIPLVCYFPFTETVTDVSSGWSYGQGYMYGMGLRYGDQYSYNITSSPSTFKIYHAGSAPLPPQIKITGQFTNLQLSDNRGNTLMLTRTNGPGDIIDIDCENFRVTLNGTQNIYSQSNNVWFQLPKGETTFTVSATGAINCTIAFTPFRHRYIY